MDSVKFYPNGHQADGKNLTEVTVKINGKELLELIKERELPFAAKDGQTSIAGAYAYLNLSDFRELFLDAISPEGRLPAGGEREAVLLACPTEFGAAGISR